MAALVASSLIILALLLIAGTLAVVGWLLLALGVVVKRSVQSGGK